MREERLARVRIAWDMVVELLKSRRFLDPDADRVVRIDGLPADAELERWDARDSRYVELVVRSDSFGPVAPGAEIPAIEILCESQPLPARKGKPCPTLGEYCIGPSAKSTPNISSSRS